MFVNVNNLQEIIV